MAPPLFQFLKGVLSARLEAIQLPQTGLERGTAAVAPISLSIRLLTKPGYGVQKLPLPSGGRAGEVGQVAQLPLQFAAHSLNESCIRVRWLPLEFCGRRGALRLLVKDEKLKRFLRRPAIRVTDQRFYSACLT